jgi:hypothetical protein
LEAICTDLKSLFELHSSKMLKALKKKKKKAVATNLRGWGGGRRNCVKAIEKSQLSVRCETS